MYSYCCTLVLGIQSINATHQGYRYVHFPCPRAFHLVPHRSSFRPRLSGPPNPRQHNILISRLSPSPPTDYGLTRTVIQLIILITRSRDSVTQPPNPPVDFRHRREQLGELYPTPQSPHSLTRDAPLPVFHTGAENPLVYPPWLNNSTVCLAARGSW